MLHLAAVSFLLHPLGYCSGTPGQVSACRGYNFWSGIFSDATIFTGFVAVLGAFWRTHNCHVHRCWRLLWHTHPVHGHPVCRHHHPHTVYADRVDETVTVPTEVRGPSPAEEGPGTPSVVGEARGEPGQSGPPAAPSG